MKTVQLSNGKVMQYPDDWDWNRIKADLDRQYPEAGRKSALAAAAATAQYPKPNEPGPWQFGADQAGIVGPMREGYGQTNLEPPEAGEELTDLYRQQRLEAGMERLKYGREIGQIEWPKYDTKGMDPFKAAATEALSLLNSYGEELDTLPETYLGRKENPQHVRLAGWLKRMQDRHGDPKTDWVNYLGENMPMALPGLAVGSAPVAAVGVAASPIINIMNMRRVRKAAERYADNKASDEDLITLAYAIREQERLADRGLARRAMDVTAKMPQFATEMALPYTKALRAGQMVGRGARALKAIPAVGAALRGAAKYSGAEFVGKMAARGAVGAAWNPQRVMEFAEARRLYKNEDLGTALAKGFVDATIEYGSETFGEMLPRATAVKAMTRWLKGKGRFAHMTPTEFRKVMNRAGLQGVLMEVAEEQVGELARGLTVEPGDFGKWSEETWGQTMSQLMEEFLAFLPLAGLGAMAELGTTREEWQSIAEARMQRLAEKEAKQYFADQGQEQGQVEPEAGAVPVTEPGIEPDVPVEPQQAAAAETLNRPDVTAEEILDANPELEEGLVAAASEAEGGKVSRKQFADMTGVQNRTFAAEGVPRGAYRKLITDTVTLAQSRVEEARLAAAEQGDVTAPTAEPAAKPIAERVADLETEATRIVGQPTSRRTKLAPSHYRVRKVGKQLGVHVEFFDLPDNATEESWKTEGLAIADAGGDVLMLSTNQTVAQQEQAIAADRIARAPRPDQEAPFNRTRTEVQEFLRNPELRQTYWSQNRSMWQHVVSSMQQLVDSVPNLTNGTKQLVQTFESEREEFERIQASMEVTEANVPLAQPNGQWAVDESRKKKDPIEPDPTGMTDPMAMPARQRPNTTYTMDMPMSLAGPPPKHRIHSVPQIFAQLRKIAATVNSNMEFRFGLMGRLGKTAAGWYSMVMDTSRVSRPGDIPTAAHELGHSVDWHYFVTRPIRGVAADWDTEWRRAVGPAIADELELAGKALYVDPNRPPTGGYLREGFAQFVRAYLTNPALLGREFPQMTPWFEKKAEGKLLKEMKKGQKMITEYRESGAWARDEAQHVDPYSLRYKLGKAVAYFRSTKKIEDWVELFYPLKLMDVMADEYRQRRGLGKVPWNERLYETAKFTRGIGSNWVSWAVRWGPRDINGNPMKDVRSLHSIADFIQWDEAKQFEKYLGACRTLARAGKPVRMKNETDTEYNKRVGLAQSLPSIATHMSVPDAIQFVKEIEDFFDSRRDIHPNGKDDLREAAEIYWQFRAAVTEYCGQVSETWREHINIVRQFDPGNYIGMAFVHDEEFDPHVRGGKGGSSVTTGSVMKRQRGYTGQVSDLIESSFKAMQRQVDAAWKMRLSEQIARMASTTEIYGVGKWIEPVERAIELKYKAAKQDVLTRIKRDLKFVDKDGNVVADIDDVLRDLNMSTAILAIDEDADQFLEFWGPQAEYQGKKPVVTLRLPKRNANGQIVRDPNTNLAVFEPRWFYVNPALHRMLMDVDSAWLNSGNAFVDGMLGIMRAIGKTWKFGVVGARPVFNLVTNPTRDLRTFMYQTTENNPARALWCWAKTFHSELYHSIMPGQEPSDFHKVLMICGGIAGQPLSQDIQSLRTAASQIYGKRKSYFLDWHNVGSILRETALEGVEMLQFMERIPRVAELKLRAERYNDKGELRQPGDPGWSFGDPMTEAMLKDFRLVSSEVTIDFLAGGRLTKQINAYIPFFNVAFQAKRTTFRVMKRDPVRFAKYLSIYAAYVLANWFLHKDDEDYKEADNRKYLYDHFFFINPVTGEREALLIARDHEMGIALSMLEGLVDSTYRSILEQDLDAEPFVRSIRTYLDSSLPTLAPPLAMEVFEQAINKDMWTKRKIASQKGPREQQYTEYTTNAAITIGKIIKVSPARIDHAMEGVFGPALVDVLRGWSAIRNATHLRTMKEFGLEDIPVASALFKRGGALGYRPQSIEKVWALRDEAEVAQYDRENPETPRQRQRRLMLVDATQAFIAFDATKRAITDRARQRQITRAELELAKKVLKDIKAIDEDNAPVVRNEAWAARLRAQRTLKQEEAANAR